VTAPHLAPGHTVAGRYRIRALLGFAGEVATYHASASDGRDVVLRLYDPAIGQRADVMTQLERTHAVLTELVHEGAVPVIDAGYDVSTSSPFSVTEKLPMPSLARLLDNGPLAGDIVGTILHGLARVLESAHARQLFHHALKPTNVFVGPGPTYAVRVTDFGASIVRAASPTHETYASSAPWWAPEQLQPGSVLGPATDVFTAALIGFFSMTGRSYWLSCQSTPPDLPAWQLEIMGRRVPASQRGRELGAMLNGALDGVFARALSVSQSDRPRSAAEIAQAIQAVGQGVAAGIQTIALADAADVFGPQAAGYAPVGSPSRPSADGYPPAPAPRYGAASGPGMAPPHGHGPTQPLPQFAEMGAGGAGPYGGFAGPGRAASGVDASGPHGGPAPGLPPIPPPSEPQRPRGAMRPVLIAVAGAVLLGGVALAVLFGRRSGDDARSPTSEASAEAEPSASVAPPTASGAPLPSGEASPPASARADEPPKVAVVIVCIPECDQILIDADEVDPAQKIELLPGKHTVQAIKAGFIPVKDLVTVELDKPFKREYRLQKIGSGKAPSPPPKKGKCGLFLKCN
jgi:hypothetical protein